MVHTKRSATRWIGVLVLALTAAGCGGGGDSGASSPREPFGESVTGTNGQPVR